MIGVSSPLVDREFMNAVIYAAGRALRLGPQSAECPKILLRIGGFTLLERHVALLQAQGIERIAVVTGHRRELVAAEIEVLRPRWGLPIEEIFNADFTLGSVLSMGASIPWLRAQRNPVLIMDGDVLYDQRLLARLVGSPQEAVLLLDRGYSTADDDPVLVPVRNGRPFEFLKRWQGTADSVGESIGFFKLAPAVVSALIAETESRSNPERNRESYDEVLRALVQAGRLGHEDVTGVPWTEIDFPEDIAYAEQTVLPQLQALPRPRSQG